MNGNASPILNRKREIQTEGAGVVYEGKNLTSLLLRKSETLSEEERIFLVECYTHYGRDFFEKNTCDNKIIPFAAHVLIDLECDVDFWRKKHNFYVKRNQAIKDLLESIFATMSDFQCESVTLTENFAVLLATNACIGCFSSGDVDLSADISERGKIVDWFRSFNFLSNDPPQSIGEYSGQSMQFFNPDSIDGGFWINVIWKPVTRAFLVQDKYDVRLSKDRLLARTLGKSSIRILDDTSLLYFCALHISAGHYFTLTPGLRLFVDIDRLARSPRIDWDNIVKWELEDNAGIRISMMMYLVAEVFDTPIPEKVYSKALQSRRNRRFARYLLNRNTNEVQSNSSRLRRLYIELASDDKNLVTNFLIRFLRLVMSRI
jgi:hypothetical protein